MQAGAVSRRNDLEDILTENALGARQFVGAKILPALNVDEQDGRFDKLAFSEVKTAAVDDRMANGAASNKVQHEMTTDNYSTVERALKEFISNRDKKIIASFDLEVSAAKLVQYYLMLNYEKRVADIAFDTTTTFVSYTTAVATKWTTNATATPVKDVETAKVAIIDQLNGMVDGAMFIGVGNATTRTALRATTDIKNRWTQGNNKTTGLADVSDAQIAEALGLDAVYFSRIAQAGSQIWDITKFGIYMVSDSPQIKAVPRVGNTFVWTDNSPSMWNAKSWETEDPEGTYVRIQTDSVEKMITARAGHVLTNVQ